MTNRSAFTKVLIAVAVIAVVSHAPAQELGNKHVGRQPDGSVVVPTNQIVTPAGQQVNFYGRPYAVAVNSGFRNG